MTGHNSMEQQVEDESVAPLWAQAMQASLSQLQVQMEQMHQQMLDHNQRMQDTSQRPLGTSHQILPSTTQLEGGIRHTTQALSDGMQDLRIEENHLLARQAQPSSPGMNDSLLHHKLSFDLHLEIQHARKHNKLVHPFDLHYIPLRILGPLLPGCTPAIAPAPALFPHHRSYLHKLTTDDLEILLRAYDQPMPLEFEARQHAFGHYIGVDDIYSEVQYSPCYVQ